MTDNQFDNFIRAKLHDHSAPVPAGLWDKVNPAKDDDRKGIILPKKSRWGLPLIALLLLTASVTGYLMFGKDSDTSIGQTLPSAQDGNSVTSGITLSNNRHEAESNPASAIMTTTTNIPSSTPLSINNTPLQKTEVIANTTVNKSELLKTTQEGLYDNEGTVTIKNSNKKLLKAETEAYPSFLKNNRNTQQVSFADIKKETVADHTTISEEMGNAYPMTFSSKLEQGNLVSLSRMHYSFNSMQPEQISAAYSRKFRNIIVCPPSSTGNKDWFVEVYASPDIPFKSIQNTTATQQYLQKKDSSESMRLGYSAGVRLVKPITDNFLVKTGLQFTQINEKFTYRTEDEVRTTTVISVRTIIRGPGDTLRIADTSTVMQTGFKTNTIKNRYRSFDIPVTVGYQFGKNENLRFGINAGVIFNLSSWYQGVILDTSLTTVPITKGNNSTYKTNIGLGLYGGISILKQLGENSQLFFEPYFRYNLSGITNNQSSYQQRFSIGGLSIGLRYQLNRK